MEIVKFYRNDPNAPKTTMRARLGANAVITWDGKILLEKRRDCDLWGLVGGGVKRGEHQDRAMVREIREELGLKVKREDLKKLAVYGEPGRIAAYRDGSIWRMVIVVYGLQLEEEPQLQISDESRQLRFFSKEELKDIDIVVTHSDIVEDWFINAE
ncbi:MAG: NUDIX domain-containing protein [Oscillospiraceae bacterium]|nr:NUDIX domain-containing protein [Oscillospiraceae bacterium]